MSELSGKDAMKLQKLYSYTRQAIQDFNMIEEGDKIAVGISGGKDSLALLYSLAGLRNFYPKKFSIIAITVDLGFGNFDLTEIKKLCAELEVEFHIEKTQIAEILKQKISKATGVPLTKQGLERKVGGALLSAVTGGKKKKSKRR